MQTAFTENFIDVFIVEDSPLVVERLELLLTELPKTRLVGKSDNIGSALKNIQLQLPKVVIIDIHLKEDAPESNGIDLLQILRKTYPKMILIMLTNITVNQYKEKCLNLGANYFLDKSNDFLLIQDILGAVN